MNKVKGIALLHLAAAGAVVGAFVWLMLTNGYDD
mgnify:CR=1 FL=1